MGKYHTHEFTVDPSVFQHPADKAATTALRTAPAFEKALAFISQNSVEKAMGISYSSSYIRLTEKISPQLNEMVHDAMQLFGETHCPDLYLERSYQLKATVSGKNTPLILMSSEVLELLDEETAWSWIAGKIAGIRNGYGEIRLVDKLCQYSGLVLPEALVVALRVLILNWRKSAVFSLDRAELIATRDFNTTMRSIMVGALPKEVLQGMDFSSPECSYFKQCRAFVQNDHLVFDFLRDAGSVLREDVYLAARYLELWKFYQSEYHDILETNA